MKKHWKLISLGVVMSLTLAIIIVNVFVVTLGQYHVLSQTDLEPHVTDLNVFTRTLQAKRGDILDRDGVAIATDSRTFNLYAILDENRMDGNKPAYVVDVQQTAEAIAPLIGMEVSDMVTLMSKDVYQTEFGLKGRNLSLSTKEAIEALNLPGIEFMNSYKRSYPLGVFSSNLIGLARYDDVQKIVKGQWGLESLYESELIGTNGSITYQQDLYGYILDGTTINETKAINGNSVYLTLDQTIQEALESAFQSTLDQIEAEDMFGAVMEIDTGKILAWGQSPSYDPNHIEQTSEQTFLNYGLQGALEPGSTFKAFTFAAAIDSSTIQVSDLFNADRFHVGTDANGKIIRSETPTRYGTITNFDRKDWGIITYEEAFIRSSNTGTAKLVTDMGKDIFYDYVQAFGFTTPVQPDRFLDTAGSIAYTYPIEVINTSFGQGVTVSVVQMLQAYSAILGDGSMIKPHFIDKIVDENNEVVYQSETEIVGNPIRPDTAKQVQNLMYGVVHNEQGSARRYNLDSVDIIAKTGTAQVVEDGKYSSENVISSVVIGFPYEDPQILIYYGYKVAMDDIFEDDVSGIKNLVHTISLMYENTNGNDVESTNQYFEIDLPQLVNHSISYALSTAKTLNISLEIIGDGVNIIDQYPKGTQSITSAQKVFLLTDGKQLTMPDMMGWTKKDVTNFWALTGIEIQSQGSGIVVDQSVTPGQRIEQSTKINVILE